MFLSLILVLQRLCRNDDREHVIAKASCTHRLPPAHAIAYLSQMKSMKRTVRVR